MSSPASPSGSNYRYIHVRKVLERGSSFAQEDFDPGTFIFFFLNIIARKMR
jgi:hypothetical protein